MPRSDRIWFVERLKTQNEYESNAIKKARRIYGHGHMAVRLDGER